MRERGAEGDADDHGTATLEDCEDVAIAADKFQHTLFGLTLDGHVYWEAYNTTYSTPLASTPSWLNPDLRDALGFSGDEVVTNVDFERYRLVADNLPPSMMVLARPMERLYRGTEQGGSDADLIGGDSYAVATYDRKTTEADFTLEGPADGNDETCKWRREMVPRLHKGMAVTLYQDWPETRRSSESCDGETYNSLQTTELDGYRGRLLGWMSENAAGLIRWPGRLRSRAAMTLRFKERDG